MEGGETKLLDCWVGFFDLEGFNFRRNKTFIGGNKDQKQYWMIAMQGSQPFLSNFSWFSWVFFPFSWFSWLFCSPYTKIFDYFARRRRKFWPEITVFIFFWTNLNFHGFIMVLSWFYHGFIMVLSWFYGWAPFSWFSWFTMNPGR